MPLTLLFSTQYNTDEVITIPADIISARSLVIEIIPVAGVTRRMAGWMYSVVDTGLGDEEIADSKRLVFGKNRVEFTTHSNPYRLKFFPVYGMRNFDINVYSGSDRLDAGTQLNASFVGRLATETKNGVVQYRSTTGGTWVTVTLMGGVAQAYYRPVTNVVIVRTHQNEIFYCFVGTWTWVADTVTTMRNVIGELNTRALVRVSA